MPECYIRGSTIKYVRIPDEVIDMVKEEAVLKSRGRGELKNRSNSNQRGGRGTGRSMYWKWKKKKNVFLFIANINLHIFIAQINLGVEGNLASLEILIQLFETIKIKAKVEWINNIINFIVFQEEW
mgnify:CR=1 FL=1